MHDTWEQKQKLSLEKESERKELMVEQGMLRGAPQQVSGERGEIVTFRN